MNHILLFVLAMAGGGDNAERAIETCQRTSSDADRIACLEAVILARRPVMTEDSPSTTQLADTGTPPPAEADPKPDKSGIETPDPVQDLQSGKSSPALPVASPVDQPSVQTVQPASTIGSEQVEARASGDQALKKASDLSVAAYGELPYGKILVTLKNGQVWRQLRSDRQTIRVSLGRNQTVDIEESAFGGYRMRLNEMRRMIRVERIR